MSMHWSLDVGLSASANLPLFSRAYHHHIITSYSIITYHIISYQIISHLIIWCHIISPLNKLAITIFFVWTIFSYDCNGSCMNVCVYICVYVRIHKGGSQERHGVVVHWSRSRRRCVCVCVCVRVVRMCTFFPFLFPSIHACIHIDIQIDRPTSIHPYTHGGVHGTRGDQWGQPWELASLGHLPVLPSSPLHPLLFRILSGNHSHHHQHHLHYHHPHHHHRHHHHHPITFMSSAQVISILPPLHHITSAQLNISSFLSFPFVLWCQYVIVVVELVMFASLRKWQLITAWCVAAHVISCDVM